MFSTNLFGLIINLRVFFWNVLPLYVKQSTDMSKPVTTPCDQGEDEYKDAVFPGLTLLATAAVYLALCSVTNAGAIICWVGWWMVETGQ